MKSAEIREAFLRYFESKSHQRVDSSSLIPDNDATLLFTNAGMNQFKDVFLGRESRPYTTATSSQRCVRAGGKHNDLDNVGYTARHHTFFEMLGNFSFGDYFKRQAIEHAWSFLTEELKLPAEKLWITVYQDDQEAEDIWLKHMGVSSERFSRLGEKDNFWSMGDTGPCGPCSEIFYDHGEDVPGGPPGSPNEDQDRYIEIWNLVFMQYNRDASGTLTPLPKPSVDTGMGLERLAAVLQGVHNNYDIDLFQNLISAVAAQCPDPVNSDLSSQRVIADHIRSCAFLVSDGLSPSNEGAGYVLRRITRRAIRHGHSLGIAESFFHRLVAPLVVEMGDAYPQLKQQQAHIEKVLLTEEEQFAKTLDRGMRLLEQDLSLLKGSVIPGETVFKLYDTYGFPVDLTEDIAREKGLTIDVQGFEAAMAKQKQAGKKAGQFGNNYNLSLAGETQFSGYDHFQGLSEVLALFADGETVEQIDVGDEAILVLESTPFYAESGGQVGDVGYIRGDAFSFKVNSTSKGGDHHFHHGKMEFGQLSKAQQVEAIVDDENRDATALNHSATHLLHAVLRETLGDHVTQKGSLVDADKLRFDFSNNEGVTEEQLLQIERRVNIEIRRNTEVSTLVTDIDTAKAQGAMALFGEKYGDEVRVLSMADGFSVELCGGTHVNRTGDIGIFKIVSESGIAAGIRRIEAVTGNVALELNLQSEQQLKQLSGLLKSARDGIAEKVSAMLKQHRSLEKQVEQLKAKQASHAGADLMGQVTEISGIKTLAAHVEGADKKALLSILDQLKNKMGSGIVLLAAKIGDEKVALVAGVSKDLCKQYKAGDLIKLAAAEVGGKGGGRPDMAQAGGSQPENIPQALASLAKWLVK